MIVQIPLWMMTMGTTAGRGLVKAIVAAPNLQLALHVCREVGYGDDCKSAEQLNGGDAIVDLTMAGSLAGLVTPESGVPQ